MSVRKRRKRDRDRARPPVSAAGLMTFFEEEIGGIKIRPEMVLLSSLLVIVVVLLAHLGFFGL